MGHEFRDPDCVTRSDWESLRCSEGGQLPQTVRCRASPCPQSTLVTNVVMRDSRTRRCMRSARLLTSKEGGVEL